MTLNIKQQFMQYELGADAHFDETPVCETYRREEFVG